MFSQSFVRTALVIVLLVAPLLYLAFLMQSLPDTVPLHYGIDGQPDRFGPKRSLWVPHIVLTIVGSMLYFMMSNQAISNNLSTSKTPPNLAGFALSAAIMLSALQFGLIYLVLHPSHPGKMVGVISGLFLAGIGNAMHSIKPNYIVGFRLPTTLANEDNWRKTHYFGSKLWVVGGLLIALISLLSSNKWMFMGVLFLLIMMGIAPAVYSRRLANKKA